MKVVVINGAAGAGKDEFVKQCQKQVLWCKNISTVDFVKDIAKKCGWNGEKTPKDRAFLSDLKKLLGEWNDVPFQKTIYAIQAYEATALSYDFSTNDVLVFVHCREPKEIARFVKEMNATALLITRPEADSVTPSNISDAKVRDYQYDYVIDNSGTIEDLYLSASQFLDRIGIKKVDFQKKNDYNNIILS